MPCLISFVWAQSSCEERKASANYEIKILAHNGIRTHNPQITKWAPYPLDQAGFFFCCFLLVLVLKKSQYMLVPPFTKADYPSKDRDEIYIFKLLIKTWCPQLGLGRSPTSTMATGCVSSRFNCGNTRQSLIHWDIWCPVRKIKGDMDTDTSTNHHSCYLYTMIRIEFYSSYILKSSIPIRLFIHTLVPVYVRIF